MAFVVKMDMVTRVQILDKAVSISYTLEKGMNPAIGQPRLFNFTMATGQGKRKLWI